MEQNSKYIIGAFLSVGVISSLYFLSLLLPVPFFVTIAAIAVATFFTCRWVVATKEATTPIPWQAVLACVVCMYLFTKNALAIVEKHGAWDAWAIWNFHADFMAYPQYWKNIFRNIEGDHPDYPLALPSFIGFLYRLTAHHFTLIIPFVFSMLVTISVPLLLFSEFIKKNWIWSVAVLFLFAQDKFYITFGVAQYADTLLGLYFLCAFVCMQHAAKHPRYIAFAAACLGACMWTKNEGMTLAGLFSLFHVRTFLKRGHIQYALMGFCLPVITLVMFRLNAHAANDMVNSLNSNTWQMVKDPERYKTIVRFFLDNINQKFYYVKIGCYLYGIVCLIEKKLPSRESFLIFCCLTVYMLIYIVTTHGLEWHLQTSQDRLIHQLMPAFVYVIMMRLTNIKFGYQRG